MSTLLRFEAQPVSRSLVADPPFSDSELEMLCFKNEEIQIERSSRGVIRLNALNGALTSDCNSEIIWQLGNWCHTHEWGRFLGSNVGFFLADGSMLSPDAAYVLPEQLRGFTKDELSRLPASVLRS